MAKIAYIDKAFQKKSLAIIAAANSIIEEYANQGFNLTLRQLYYQFVARDLIPNTERSYKRIGSLISDGRMAGLIDWNAIVDRTRNLVGNSHWDSPAEVIASARYSYGIDMWANQDVRVEVWIEKEALVGVIAEICDQLDVPYFACKGYVSQSEQWRAGERALENHCDTVILHLGDHDPSGIDMTRDNQERLNTFSDYKVTVERIALNMNQVEEHKPPPNPAKVTDSRFDDYLRRFGAKSWELDALEPSVLAALIEDRVNAHRDPDAWQEREQQLETDRLILDRVVADLS